MLDIQTVHYILKNTAVQNVNKPFVYITDLTSTLKLARPVAYCICNSSSFFFVFLMIICTVYSLQITPLMEVSSELLRPACLNKFLYVCMYSMYNRNEYVLLLSLFSYASDKLITPKGQV